MMELNRGPSVEDVRKSINGAIQMYGRYSPSNGLSEFAKDEERRLQALEAARQSEPNKKRTPMESVARIWRLTLGRWGEDWVFLALLGTIMAMLSYAMDEVVALSFKARLWLLDQASVHIALQYVAWVSVPIVVMVCAALLVGKTAPQAAGSGLPELKAILRGGQLKGFFGPQTLLAKVVGITSTLGSGLPLGREGSLIHISSIIGTMLSKLVGSLNSLRNAKGADAEFRNYDALAAGCAVGVATTFAAPIGGVLFSIEVFSVYFAVRNYWRGFFAAVFGAAIFRLLAVWFSREDTVVAIYLTNFSMDFPFDPQELVVYAFVGVISGFGAAAYIWMHRQCVTFVRTNRIVQKYIYLFVAFTVLTTMSLTFPPGIGKYMGGDIYTVDQVKALFKNFTWTKDNFTTYEADIMSHWNVDQLGVFSSLGIFIVFTWFFSIWCSSMPVPLGNFGPVFKMGAAVGRFVGELLLVYSPGGFRYGKILDPVIPGSYATVGAAAFSGAVTHTVSTSVIVFEMTGQVTHIFPIMIAVLIANGICTILQPSIYDSIIMIKKLPFLPHLHPTAYAYIIYVKDFMVKNIKYVWHGITYGELLDILNENEDISSFPLVNSRETMILLGTIQRDELQKLIDQHLGDERRLYVAAQRRTKFPERLSRHNSRDSLRLNFDEISQQGSTDDLIVTYVLPKPPRNSNMGIFNPVMQASDETIFRQLRKSNSFTLPKLQELPDSTTNMEDGNKMYHTFHTPASNRPSIRNVLRRSSSSAAGFSGTPFVTSNPNPDASNAGNGAIRDDYNDTLHSLQESIDDVVHLAGPLVVDMTPDERRRWEASELRKAAALGVCNVDPSPFQLVVTTPLVRAHSLFCLLKVRKAYVTHVGRLVGVVSLPELRKATEASNARTLPTKTSAADSTAAAQENLPRP